MAHPELVACQPQTSPCSDDDTPSSRTTVSPAGDSLARVKVVVVVDSLAQGGAERQALEVARRLPADRFEEAFAIVEGGECGKVILDWA